jgi:hypothetical protein
VDQNSGVPLLHWQGDGGFSRRERNDLLSHAMTLPRSGRVVLMHVVRGERDGSGIATFLTPCKATAGTFVLSGLTEKRAIFGVIGSYSASARGLLPDPAPCADEDIGGSMPGRCYIISIGKLLSRVLLHGTNRFPTFRSEHICVLAKGLKPEGPLHDVAEVSGALAQSPHQPRTARSPSSSCPAAP